MIVYDPRKKVFWYKCYNKEKKLVRYRCNGLTKTISKHFFKKKWSLRSVSGTRGGGADLGRRVDREITHWTRQYPKKSSYNSTNNNNNNNYCAETKQLIRYCTQREWEPLYSQLTVGSGVYRIATRCDLVLQHKHSKKRILLEIKTGYLDTFKGTQSCGKSGKRGREKDTTMRPPFSDLNASPYHYSLIQLLWTWILYSTRFPRSSLLDHSSVMVAHVTKQQVDTYTIPASLGVRFRKKIQTICNLRVSGLKIRKYVKRLRKKIKLPTTKRVKK